MVSLYVCKFYDLPLFATIRNISVPFLVLKHVFKYNKKKDNKLCIIDECERQNHKQGV